MIRIRGLTKRFGRSRAVDRVDLDVPAGDAVALWGANGAGKTTLIRCVLGLYRYEGSIEVGGHDALRRGKEARRLIGYVPQELGFQDDLRVAEAVRLFARLKGERVAGVDGVLERVHLEGQGRKRVRDLSGGMKQRLALAVALLGEPPILVLDEVTASLDACGRDEFMRVIATLAGDGRTLLFASHRIDEVTTLARRIVLLERGAVASECAPDAFADRVQAGSMLHLHIPAGARESAMQALRANGFRPHSNGVGLLVPVERSSKAAPFRVLADARISIDDFDLVTGHRDGARDRQGAQP